MSCSSSAEAAAQPQEQPVSIRGCDLAALLLGALMVFGGVAGVAATAGSQQGARLPIVAVPAVVLLTGVISFMAALISARRKNKRLQKSLPAAPNQAQPATAPSYTTTVAIGSPPIRCCGRDGCSDEARCTRCLEATTSCTRAAHVNRAMVVLCPDDLPPSYEVVMQSQPAPSPSALRA